MRFIPLLLLTQFTYPFGQNLNGGPITLVCDGGISCSQQGELYYVSGSGAAGGSGGGSGGYDGGKVAEAFMADASITAQIANVAYSADAGYYATEFIVNPTDCSAGQYATAIAANGNLTCSTPPGGGGSANVVEVDVNFGTGTDSATVVVTGQTWVTSTSKIVCSPTLLATSTRAEGEEDPVVEGLIGAVYSRVAGTGFTLYVAPTLGVASGVVKFHCTGA